MGSLPVNALLNGMGKMADFLHVFAKNMTAYPSPF
jgi:hypothetical protein